MCEGGTCRCPPLFDGENCTALRLKPARLDSGLRLPNATTWGGGIVRDAEGNVWVFRAPQHVHSLLLEPGYGIDVQKWESILPGAL